MLKLVFLLTLPAIVFNQILPARVDIFYDSITGVVNQYVMGSGDEMVENFTMPGLDSLMRKTNCPFLRFGGFSAEYYDWEGNNYNGIFYLDFFDTLIIPLPLSFGVDSLLRLCERLNIPALLTVNFQISDPRKAARYVEYCNGDTNTPMGRLRANRGHPAPYNVTYWAIGNEPDISGLFFPGWNITFYRHFGIPFNRWNWRDSSFVNPVLFSNLVRTYCDSMRAHSPIPLKIVGLSLANNTAWIGPVIGPNNTRINLVDIHYYPNYDTLSDSTRYRQWLASPDTTTPWRLALDVWIDMVRDSIRRYSGGNQIDLAICEYNSGLIFAKDPVWWNYVNGLFIADVIGHLIRKSVVLGGVYSIYDKTDTTDFPTFGIIRGDSLSQRMACHVITLYRQTVGNNVLKTLSNAVASGTGLEAFGTKRVDGNIGVIFVNKDPHNAFAASIYHRGFISNRRAHKWTITNNAPVGAPYNGTTGIVDRGYILSNDSTFIIDTIPRYSVSALMIEKRTEVVENDKQPRITDTELMVYPNPTGRRINIRFHISDDRNIRLKVFDASGRVVKNLSPLLSGIQHRMIIITWDGTSDENEFVPAGVYFVQLETSKQRLVRSLVKIRLD